MTYFCDVVVLVSLVRNVLQPQQRVHGILEEESLEPSALDDISSDAFLFESPILPLDGVSPAALSFSLIDDSDNQDLELVNDQNIPGTPIEVSRN